MGLMSQEIYYYLILLSFFGRSNYIFDSHLLLSNYQNNIAKENPDIQMKFAIILETCPEIIKMSPVIRKCEQTGRMILEKRYK
jgi:hypothetical protein